MLEKSPKSPIGYKKVQTNWKKQFLLIMKEGHCVIPTNGAKLTKSCQYNTIIVRIQKSVTLHSMFAFYCVKMVRDELSECLFVSPFLSLFDVYIYHSYFVFYLGYIWVVIKILDFFQGKKTWIHKEKSNLTYYSNFYIPSKKFTK